MTAAAGRRQGASDHSHFAVDPAERNCSMTQRSLPMNQPFPWREDDLETPPE